LEEEDARLALLQAELSGIQSGIRGLDAIIFQIKGWCVTASLAIGGFAVAYHRPALLIVGAGAVGGFYILNAQFKLLQRAFINRNQAVANELKQTGIMQFLKGGGKLEIVGTVTLWGSSSPGPWYKGTQSIRALWAEACMPNTFGLYLFILACLGLEALIL
jgi:hypothetical protein